MINKLKKLLNMDKKTPTNEEVFDQQIQSREETEAAADNIDAVEEPMNQNDPYVQTESFPQADTDKTEDNTELADTTFLETSAEAVGYENRESQWDTYRVMSSYFQPEYSILDYGCARGDFKSFYLSEYEVELDYTGIDFNPQLIDAGLKINPDTNLVHADWKTYREPADWCINIGSHDVRYDADSVTSDMDYLMKTIESMYNNCTMGLSIMLASDTLQQDEGIITWPAGDVLNMVLSKFGTASIDHSYSDAIFTLIIYKNN